MAAQTYQKARVSPAQSAYALHLLAALNHRQWGQWQAHTLPMLQAALPREVLEQWLEDADMSAFLTEDAMAAIKLVERATGTFAYEPDLELVIERKNRQLQDWVRYAADQDPSSIERWLLQCRTPFLDLTSQQQASDYEEARRDLVTVAKAGGLVLPNPLPNVLPLMGNAARWRKFKHTLRFHGDYPVSEEPWANTCQACNTVILFEYPAL